jgi:hypothetical protein
VTRVVAFIDQDGLTWPCNARVRATCGLPIPPTLSEGTFRESEECVRK